MAADRPARTSAVAHNVETATPDTSGQRMTDDKSKPAGLDNDFVSLDEPWQVHYWTTKLKCTPDELRAAIAEVGQAVPRIRAHLSQT
jgi:hypothetical protein